MEESTKPTWNFISENPVLFYYHTLEEPELILEAETLSSGKERKEDRTSVCSALHIALMALSLSAHRLVTALQVSPQQHHCCDGNPPRWLILAQARREDRPTDRAGRSGRRWGGRRGGGVITQRRGDGGGETDVLMNKNVSLIPS